MVDSAELNAFLERCGLATPADLALLVGYVRKETGVSSETASDCAWDAVLGVACVDKAKPGSIAEHKLRAYVFVVAGNKARSEIRKANAEKRGGGLSQVDILFDEVALVDPPLLERREDLAILAKCFDLLQEKDRTILMERIAGGRPFEEIALELGMSCDACRQRFARAKQRLWICWNGYFHD